MFILICFCFQINPGLCQHTGLSAKFNSQVLCLWKWQTSYKKLNLPNFVTPTLTSSLVSLNCLLVLFCFFKPLRLITLLWKQHELASTRVPLPHTHTHTRPLMHKQLWTWLINRQAGPSKRGQESSPVLFTGGEKWHRFTGYSSDSSALRMLYGHTLRSGQAIMCNALQCKEFNLNWETAWAFWSR